MKRIGTLTEPVTEVMKHLGSDHEALDVLFDLATEKKQLFLVLKQLQLYKEQVMYIVGGADGKTLALLLYSPSEVWNKNPEKKYVVWVAPSIRHLINYFKKKTAFCKDENEYNEIQKVLKYLHRNESSVLVYQYKE